ARDDRGGLVLGRMGLAPILGDQRLRLFLEAACLVELAPDAIAALIDTVEHDLLDAEIDQHADEGQKRDRHPGFGFKHRIAQLLRTAPTAASTSGCAGATPISRSTIAPAASAAMPRTFVIAADFRSAMVFSASAMRALSVASSSLRLASAAAASRSRLSL